MCHDKTSLYILQPVQCTKANFLSPLKNALDLLVPAQKRFYVLRSSGFVPTLDLETQDKLETNGGGEDQVEVSHARRIS